MTDDNDDICFIASATDLLGNRSKLPAAEKACATPTDDPATDDVDESLVSSIRAGVDITAPTIAFTGASPEADSRVLEDYDLRVKDEKDGSGLHSMPVLARVLVRDTKKTTCGPDDLPGDENLLGECENDSEGLADRDGDRVATTYAKAEDLDDGYYTFTAQAQDKAGNKSDPEISRVALNDNTDPVVSVSVSQGSKDGDFDHSLTGAVTDGLSIRDYAIGLIVGDVSYGLEGDPDDRMVDAYDADPLTTSEPLNQNITLPFLALQEVGEGELTMVDLVEVTVRDQADRSDEGSDDIKIEDKDLAKSAFANTDDMNFMVMPEGDADTSTLTIEAEVTGEDNPFKSVIFYAEADSETGTGYEKDLRFIDSVPEYSASPSNGGWTYRARVSADDFYAAVGGEDDYDGMVYAVGVGADRTEPGAESKVTVTTTTVAGSQTVVEGGSTTTNENTDITFGAHIDANPELDYPDEDGDGIVDAADAAGNTDTDNDGVNNTADSHPADTDNDGISNTYDLTPGEDVDGDEVDGIVQTEDEEDEDGDGIADFADADADGDGNQDSGAVDTDSDGILDAADSYNESEATEPNNTDTKVAGEFSGLYDAFNPDSDDFNEDDNGGAVDDGFRDGEPDNDADINPATGTFDLGAGQAVVAVVVIPISDDPETTPTEGGTVETQTIIGVTEYTATTKTGTYRTITTTSPTGQSTVKVSGEEESATIVKSAGSVTATVAGLDIETTIEDDEIEEVKTTESTTGEATTIKGGGVGLKSEGARQEVDER